jgi:hypothetical protein
MIRSVEPFFMEPGLMSKPKFITDQPSPTGTGRKCLKT